MFQPDHFWQHSNKAGCEYQLVDANEMWLDLSSSCTSYQKFGFHLKYNVIVPPVQCKEYQENNILWMTSATSTNIVYHSSLCYETLCLHFAQDISCPEWSRLNVFVTVSKSAFLRDLFNDTMMLQHLLSWGRSTKTECWICIRQYTTISNLVVHMQWFTDRWSP